MRTRNAVACLMSLCLLPLLGGCAEGDEVTVTSETVSLNLRGTDARDTLDLNIGTNAGFTSDGGPGVFNGPQGEVLMLFKQQHENPGFSQIPQALTQPFNYARVLTDEPGPIMAVDDHTDPNYDNYIDLMRQSWNLRYVALLNQTDEFSPRLKLVMWDFSAGAFTPSAQLATASLFSPGLFSSPFLSAQDAFVDNNGRVTVLFQAIDIGSAEDTDRALWVVQYDTTTRLITRAPTIISGAFRVPGNANNGADYIDGRIAANGDIAILFRKNDNYGGAAAPIFQSVLYSVVYKAGTNTWGPATRADNGLDDRFGTPVAMPLNVVLDTDANSFQYAFIQNSDGFGGNLPAVYTSRFVASAGTAFAVPTRIDTTSAVGLERVANPSGGGVDIHFGRNGASLVHWVQTETGQFSPIDTIWASHSSNTVAPAAANSAELLNASMPAHAGYTVTTLRAVLTASPAVAFDDAGNAIIAFRAFNNEATPDAEVYVATFDGGAITAATVGTDNLATLPAVAAGQTRFVDNLAVSGFSGGANPRCVVGWTTEHRNASNTTLGSGAWGVVYSGLVAAGVATQVSSTTGSTLGTSLRLASANRFSTSVKVLLGLGDSKLVTDEYPAYGTGAVWLVNGRMTPPASPSASNTYDEIRLVSFNPAVHANVVENGSSVTTLGQIDHMENWSLLADGSCDFAFGVFGYHFQRSYVASAAAGGDPFGSAPQLLTPPDMKQVSQQFPQGLHVDGINFVRTAGGGGVVSALVNVPRRWTLWMAQDTKSQRIFGVRSR